MWIAAVITGGIFIYLCCVYAGLRKMSRVLREGQDSRKH